MKILTTEQRCVDIVRAIAELCNKDGAISFERDWDDYCVTVNVSDGEASGHTHCGIPQMEKPKTPPAKAKAFRELVESLHSSLHGGPGLSWFPVEPKISSPERP